LDKLFEKPAKGPIFLLNLRKLFQKLKFWNSFFLQKINKTRLFCRTGREFNREGEEVEKGYMKQKFF
jgi:hypothetical protein